MSDPSSDGANDFLSIMSRIILAGSSSERLSKPKVSLVQQFLAHQPENQGQQAATLLRAMRRLLVLEKRRIFYNDFASYQRQLQSCGRLVGIRFMSNDRTAHGIFAHYASRVKELKAKRTKASLHHATSQVSSLRVNEYK